MASWREQVAPDWATALEPVEPTLARLGTFLREEQRCRARVPAGARRYIACVRDSAERRAGARSSARIRTRLPAILWGCRFPCPPGRPLPRSLQNMARELAADTGEVLASGDLTAWQGQGVMLLNRVLTVRPGLPASHRGKGWEQFTAHAIEVLVERGGPLVAVLWGRDAQALAPMLGEVAARRERAPFAAQCVARILRFTAVFQGECPLKRRIRPISGGHDPQGCRDPMPRLVLDAAAAPDDHTWSWQRDLNPQPPDYKSGALPVAPCQRACGAAGSARGYKDSQLGAGRERNVRWCLSLRRRSAAPVCDAMGCDQFPRVSRRC